MCLLHSWHDRVWHEIGVHAQAHWHALVLLMLGHHVGRPLLAILVSVALSARLPLHRGALVLRGWRRRRGLAILWERFMLPPVIVLQTLSSIACTDSTGSSANPQ